VYVILISAGNWQLGLMRSSLIFINLFTKHAKSQESCDLLSTLFFSFCHSPSLFLFICCQIMSEVDTFLLNIISKCLYTNVSLKIGLYCML
jgi:hypothetical protein